LRRAQQFEALAEFLDDLQTKKYMENGYRNGVEGRFAQGLDGLTILYLVCCNQLSAKRFEEPQTMK